MTPRKKRPRSPSPPPVIYPTLPCIGGPCDGTVKMSLSLPSDMWIELDAAGIERVVSGSYARATVNGADVWQWREVREGRS